MIERDRAHLDAGQAAAAQQGCELLVDGESEEWWAAGKVVRWCGACLGERVEEHSEETHPLRQIPGRERELAAVLEHPHELADRSLRTPQVGHNEVADDGIEGAVLEGQGLSVCLTEVDVGVSLPGPLDHGGRDVDPHHRCASFGRPGRGIARPGREIEHPRPGPHVGGVQQRVDESTREAAEEVVICRGLVLPAVRLEGVERVGVDRPLGRHRSRLIERRHAVSFPSRRSGVRGLRRR
jgi:hypothetical protein